jgi:threonine ammonia-lyase medium form
MVHTPAAASVTVDDVTAAAELIDGIVRRTPVVRSRALTDRLGGPVHLKCENLQRGGSFKLRGAYTRMARMPAEQRARGVVAASAGNHAQGVAIAARELGIDVRVYMPVGAPLPKLAATRGYGAHVEIAGTTVDEALVAARQWSAETGAVLIHPFDHVDVVAGQGTVGLEILEQVPDVRTVLVSAGGGGLLAGICVALAAHRPDVRILGVQAEGAASYPASLAAGVPTPLEEMSTMADGIAVGCPGDVPFALVGALADEVVTVSEDLISQALLLLLERQKLLVEPAGAAAVAALLGGAVAVEPPVVAVLSGGNVDPLLLMRVLRHGMASVGRYLRLRHVLPDRPGALAGLLRQLAAVDANVLEVEHVRTEPRLPVNDVEIAVWLETQGPEHCHRVLTSLRAAGYRVSVG